MNTTQLIRYWTMQGAAPDVGDRFHSTAAALAIEEDAPEPEPVVPTALRMRQSDEEEWTPLPLAAGNT